MGCQSDRISMRKKRWLVRPPMLHDIVPCLNLRKMNKVVPVFMFTSRLGSEPYPTDAQPVEDSSGSGNCPAELLTWGSKLDGLRLI